TEHPPTGLALRTVLAQQHRPVIREAPAHDRAAWLGLLRRLFEVESARLRQMEDDAKSAVEPQRHVLRPPVDALQVRADQRFRWRVVRLQTAEPERRIPLEDCAV